MVALLTSCIGNLGIEKVDVSIQFRPVIGYDTRAEESVPFPEDRSFLLWAKGSFLEPMYINAETISYNDGWRSAKFWPESKIDFHACWPLDIPVSYSLSDGLQIKGFDGSSADIDILVAQADSEKQIDGQVVLPFNHILSRVEFRMLHSLPDNMSVRLKKISMIGFASKGDYNTKVAGNWNVAEEDFTYVVYDSGEAEGVSIRGGEADYIGHEFYVIPQPCMAALEVMYEVRYDNNTWVPQTETIESLKTHWEPGKHYTYTVNLRMDKLTHTTGISSWSNRE